MIRLFPAVLYELEPGDDGYDRGARFRLDQVDGGQYGFHTQEDARMFMEIHGMIQINEPEMVRLRQFKGDISSL